MIEVGTIYVGCNDHVIPRLMIVEIEDGMIGYQYLDDDFKGCVKISDFTHLVVMNIIVKISDIEPRKYIKKLCLK